MLTKLLKLKHWQLFLLIVVMPFLIKLGGESYLSTISIKSNKKFIDYVVIYLSALSVFSFISLIVFSMWSWAIGTKIHEKIPSQLQLCLTNLKVAFGCIFLGIVSFIGYFVMMMRFFFETEEIGWVVGVFLLLLLMQLAAVGAMGYVFYHVSKTIRLAEMQTELTIKDYIADIILIFFFPIGVWFIQPRLNKLMESD